LWLVKAARANMSPTAQNRRKLKRKKFDKRKEMEEETNGKRERRKKS
jgi:hypothetical protein